MARTASRAWWLGCGGYDRDFRARPLDFRTGLGDDSNGRDAFHLLRGAGVDALDARMSVRAGEKAGKEKACGFRSDGYFARPLDFVGSVQAADALADDLALFRFVGQE